MDADEVARRLGLADDARVWFAQAAELPSAGGPVVVPPSGARRALAPFRLDPVDEEELAGLWPDGSWPAEVMWLVDRMYARLAADLAGGLSQWRDWPVLVHAEDPRVRCSVLVAMAAAVPLVLAEHARRGVPGEVSAATLGDMGRHVAQTRSMFGRLGLETATWMALHLRGGLYELGRLQYEPDVLRSEEEMRWYGRGEAAGMGPELAWGAPVLCVHIPAAGPLDAAAVEESLGRARGFFAGCFGVDYPVAVCSSWLLDPQLAEYLPESANILAFQRRFTLVDEGVAGDADVFRFVFGLPEVDAGRARERARTRLERAVLEHVGAGGRWQVRTGWLRLG